MKKSQRQRVEAFLISAAPLMELDGWRVRLLDEPCDADSDATMARVEGQKLGILRLSETFSSLDARSQKRVLCHELAHLLASDLDQYVSLALPELVGRPAFHAFYVPFNQALEVMVDSIGHAMATLLPFEV